MSRAEDKLKALIPPQVGEEIVIDGYRYVIHEVHPYTFQERQRFECYVRKPKGKVDYHAVRYEDGTWSSVTSFGRLR